MCAVATMLISACATPPPAQSPYAKAYPRQLSQSGSVDIQVVRKGTRIALTNTTARPFGPSTMWLNSRFCRPIDGLAVGQSLTLPLREFKDEFSDSFRAGGFFASERPDKVVHAQIETIGADGNLEMVGLVVVQGDY